MGWTFQERNRWNKQSTKDWFQVNMCGDKHEILACSSTFSVAYMAIKNKETGEVFGCVCLTRWNPKDVYNFGYKDMEESMGPGASDCPEKILKLLTPTTSPYAIEWRKRCWDKINARKANPPLKLKVGMTVIAPDWTSFTNGYDGKKFIVDSVRPKRFRDMYGNRYRFSKHAIAELKLDTEAPTPIQRAQLDNKRMRGTMKE
jgi:hypothetical protein